MEILSRGVKVVYAARPSPHEDVKVCDVFQGGVGLAQVPSAGISGQIRDMVKCPN